MKKSQTNPRNADIANPALAPQSSYEEKDRMLNAPITKAKFQMTHCVVVQASSTAEYNPVTK